MRSTILSKASCLYMLMWLLFGTPAHAAGPTHRTTINAQVLASLTGDTNRYSATDIVLEAHVVNDQLVQLSMDGNASCTLALHPTPVPMQHTAGITGANSGRCQILHLAALRPELHGEQLRLQFKRGDVELAAVAQMAR